MKNNLLALSILLLFISAVSYAKPPDQPYMEAARDQLQKAKAELRIAEPNKGGHRTKALAYVNSAIAEVNRGIDFARRKNHAISGWEKVFDSVAIPDQPHMQAALNYLTTAKSNLDSATADKGGHRKKAIEYVEAAIDEVQKGISFAG
jgi:hypothetical protein